MTWCYCKPYNIVFPPRKVSNPTFQHWNILYKNIEMQKSSSRWPNWCVFVNTGALEVSEKLRLNNLKCLLNPYTMCAHRSALVIKCSCFSSKDQISCIVFYWGAAQRCAIGCCLLTKTCKLQFQLFNTLFIDFTGMIFLLLKSAFLVFVFPLWKS